MNEPSEFEKWMAGVVKHSPALARSLYDACRQHDASLEHVLRTPWNAAIAAAEKIAAELPITDAAEFGSTRWNAAAVTRKLCALAIAALREGK